MKHALKLWHLAAAAALTASAGGSAYAASCHDVALKAPELREHEAHVSLQLGYVRVEFLQSIYNPNGGHVEAVLHVPLPPEATLAEVEIGDGSTTLRGEALPVERARGIVREATVSGRTFGLARLVENGDLEIRIAQLQPQSVTWVRGVYYAPHTLRSGEGRFVYPGRPPAQLSGPEIWQPQSELKGSVRLTVDFRYAENIQRIATPGFEGEVRMQEIAEDHLRLTAEAQPGEIGETTEIVYEVEVPSGGSVDLQAYRPDPQAQGAFMLVITPAEAIDDRIGHAGQGVLNFAGGRVGETTDLAATPLSRGEQQIVFGLYEDAGRNRLVLRDQEPSNEVAFDTLIAFPKRDTDLPELERLWAGGRLRTLADMERASIYSGDAVREAESKLGLKYQILTPSTDFVLLSDEDFDAQDVGRPNAARVRTERMADSMRRDLPVWATRVDLANPFFAPQGKPADGCCAMGESLEAMALFGIDLNDHPESTELAAQALRVR